MLSAALEALSRHTERLIALLIDEAQHANTTEAGASALFALKAARDELNSSRHHGLRLIATGSNRDKLAGLVNSKAQAFYRATPIDLPPLDEDYVRWFVTRQPFADELDIEMVTALFARAGHQPELLHQAADLLRLDPGAAPDTTLAERLATHLERVIAADEAEILGAVESLEPLERVVLAELAASVGRFAPFERSTLARYAAALDRLEDGGEKAVGTSAVQRALGALQRSGLVWRSHRGAYALEEPRLVELMRREGMLG